MTFNGLKIFLNLMKISNKAMQMKVMKDIFLKLMFIFLKMNYDLPLFLEKIKIENVEILIASSNNNENIFYT